MLSILGCKQNGTENVEQKFLDNECVDYFYDLTNDYPTNFFGSCGYAATAAALRYYDYMYDDTIVDSKYEQNQGLKHAAKNDIIDLNADTYYDFLKQTTEDYLQSYLIVEANEKFGIYNSEAYFPAEVKGGFYCRIGGYYAEVQAVLDYYLYILKNFSTSSITTIRLTSDVRNQLIEHIKAGNPAIVSCRDKNESGHVFIVYDYDEENDEIYGNSLTMENYNHMKISSAYETFDYVIILDYNEIQSTDNTTTAAPDDTRQINLFTIWQKNQTLRYIFLLRSILTWMYRHWQRDWYCNPAWMV